MTLDGKGRAGEEGESNGRERQKEGGGEGRGREEQREEGILMGKRMGTEDGRKERKVEGRRERREEGTTKNQPPALHQKRPRAPSGVIQQHPKPPLGDGKVWMLWRTHFPAVKYSPGNKVS